MLVVQITMNAGGRRRRRRRADGGGGGEARSDEDAHDELVERVINLVALGESRRASSTFGERARSCFCCKDHREQQA